MNARDVFADPFFAVYHRFISGRRPQLELGGTEQVWEAIWRELSAHVGLRFEAVARDTLRWLNGTEVGGISVDFDMVGRWWNRTGEELDIVAKGQRRSWPAR